MPPVPAPGETGIAWLRARVPRFRDGAEHRRARAAVQRELDHLDPEALRANARAAAGQPLAHVRALLAALGLPDNAAETVAIIAAAYQPHQPITPTADAAVTDLVTLCRATIRCGVTDDPGDAAQVRLSDPHRHGTSPTYCPNRVDGHGANQAHSPSPSHAGSPSHSHSHADSPSDDRIVAMICVLVQACAATGELLAAARDFDSGPEDERAARVMAAAPPLRSTRRVVDGVVTELDLRFPGLGFGAGPHRCPGSAHALALATGVLEGAAAETTTPEADSRRSA